MAFSDRVERVTDWIRLVRETISEAPDQVVEQRAFDHFVLEPLYKELTAALLDEPALRRDWESFTPLTERQYEESR